MNYLGQYLRMLEKPTRVGRNMIKPLNLYRISAYEYISKEQRRLSGPRAAIILVTGIYDNKVNCLKLNEISPSITFSFLKTITRNGFEKDQNKVYTSLSEILMPSDIRGNRLFESKIKNKPIYNIEPSPYRTYEWKNIIYIMETNFKNEYLNKFT